MEGALLSSNRRQRSFGNLGKACTALHSPLDLPASPAALPVFVSWSLRSWRQNRVSTRWPSSWPNFRHHHCGVLRATVD